MRETYKSSTLPRFMSVWVYSLPVAYFKMTKNGDRLAQLHRHVCLNICRRPVQVKTEVV